MKIEVSKVPTFRESLAVGEEVERLVESKLSETKGVKFKSITGADSLQEYGDFLVKSAKGNFFIEAKADEAFDKYHNIYFEMGEVYTKNYQQPRTGLTEKACTVEVVGVFKQAYSAPDVVYVHKLGKSDKFLVYSARSALRYFSEGQETSWKIDSILSKDTLQKEKFKLGVRILGEKNPYFLEEGWANSELKKFAKVCRAKNLIAAISCIRRDFAEEPRSALSLEEGTREFLSTFFGPSEVEKKVYWDYYFKERRSHTA